MTEKSITNKLIDHAIERINILAEALGRECVRFGTVIAAMEAVESSDKDSDEVILNKEKLVDVLHEATMTVTDGTMDEIRKNVSNHVKNPETIKDLLELVDRYSDDNFN